jgi:hypothetical protein
LLTGSFDGLAAKPDMLIHQLTQTSPLGQGHHREQTRP